MDKLYLEITRVNWTLLKVLRFNNVIFTFLLVIFTIVLHLEITIMLSIIIIINNIVLNRIYFQLIANEKK